MKKILIIISIILITQPALASDIGDAAIATVAAGLLSVFAVLMVASIIFSTITFLAGLTIAVPVFIVSASYYQAKHLIVNDKVEEYIQAIDLCPAAKDLNLNLDVINAPNLYISTNSELDNNYNDMKYLPKLSNAVLINKNPQLMLINKDNNTEYKAAKGIWNPTRAFTINNEEYLELLTGHQTAIAKFDDIVRELNYNNHYVFKNVYIKFKAQELCPILRRVSIHKLKNIEES